MMITNDRKRPIMLVKIPKEYDMVYFLWISDYFNNFLIQFWKKSGVSKPCKKEQKCKWSHCTFLLGLEIWWCRPKGWISSQVRASVEKSRCEFPSASVREGKSSEESCHNQNCPSQAAGKIRAHHLLPCKYAKISGYLRIYEWQQFHFWHVLNLYFWFHRLSSTRDMKKWMWMQKRRRKFSRLSSHL